METSSVNTKVRPRRLGIVQLISFGVVLVVIALFGIGIINRSAKPVEAGAAPQFSIPLYDGGTFSLAEQRGKVVVVNFWASWCIPCRDEAPMLERVWRRYKERGVVFVGVGYVDTETEALKFIKEFNLTYPNGPDLRQEVSQRFRIRGVPETFFIGKDGHLYGNSIGVISEAALVTKIEELLSK